jgi:protein involved in polysaccharide export with SLBB domain
MVAMKRVLPACALLLSAALSFSQATGFGASSPSGGTFQNGDPALVTQRILASTRYRLTPGDVYQLSVTLQGSVATYSLVLQENYELQVPYMDMLNVKGMYFADVRKLVIDRMKKLLPLADFLSLTLLSPARFDITVFGGVATPGTVTVSALHRVSDAIVLAGRRLPGASYRQISLIRGDQKIGVDLQKYAIDGQSEENPMLEPGDRLYVPPAQLTVSLSGQVRFPGVFEMLPGENLQTLVGYAGGTTPDANTSKVALVRFLLNGTSSQQIVDLTGASGIALSDGDKVRIPSRVENSEMILVTGAFFGAPVSPDRPVVIPLLPLSVNVPFSPGITLLAVLDTLGGPTPYARSKEGLVIRKQSGERIAVDVDALWSTKDPSRDLILQPGDTVSIPIATQVFVAGEVLSPGKLPFDPGMKVRDYLVASGGINPNTGDPAGIWFVDSSGGRTRADISSSVLPGTVIVVAKNSWTLTQETFTNIMVVTGFVSTIIALATRRGINSFTQGSVTE